MRISLNILLISFILLTNTISAWAALPKFLGGSGYGIDGQKANINGKYSTYWDDLMHEQSYDNMRQGLGELASAKYKEASTTFGKAVVKNPQDPWPHIFLGISLYWLGQIDSAMAEYRSALKLDENNAHAHQLLGIAYAWQGKIEDALKEFQIAIKFAPDRADTQMNLGSTYSALGKTEEALYHFRTAVELDNKHPLYHFQLGSLLEILGRDSQAKSSFNRALKLYPYYEEVMLSLAVLEEKMADFSSAKSDYEKALALKPGDSIARTRLINLLYSQNNIKDALPLFERAFLISPLDSDGLALSLSYSGTDTTQNDGNNSNKNQNNNQQNNAKANKQLSQFEKRLKKVPSIKPISLEVEILLEPKTQPNKVKENQNVENVKKSALITAVEEKDKELLATALKRNFILFSADEETREQELSDIFNGLNNILDKVGQNYNVKMALKATQVRQQPSQETGLNENVSGFSNTARNTNAKAGYNPYMVGNDMGLWVTGKSWIKFMEEILPDVLARVKKKDSFENNMLLGLVYMTLGRGADALDTFNKAKKLVENSKDTNKQYLSFLGLGTAFIVLGEEDSAITAYTEALKLNSNDKIATSNLAILKE